MRVELLHHTTLNICSTAIRTCWQSQDKSDNGGPIDKALIDRIGNKFKHASTLEHLTYTFYISGISRALLQELARHRMASLSVKSSRYTLKELKDELPFCSNDFDYKGWLTGKPDASGSYASARASKYLVWTENNRVDISSVVALENLRIQLASGIANDEAKYCMPEAYKTELTWTINARSLQNFLKLRSAKAALWEIRDLANNLYLVLPEDHKYLFEDCIGGSDGEH